MPLFSTLSQFDSPGIEIWFFSSPERKLRKKGRKGHQTFFWGGIWSIRAPSLARFPPPPPSCHSPDFQWAIYYIHYAGTYSTDYLWCGYVWCFLRTHSTTIWMFEQSVCEYYYHSFFLLSVEREQGMRRNGNRVATARRSFADLSERQHPPQILPCCGFLPRRPFHQSSSTFSSWFSSRPRGTTARAAPSPSSSAPTSRTGSSSTTAGATWDR